MVLRRLKTAATNVKITELRFVNLSLTYSCDSFGTRQLKRVKLRSATYTIFHILPGRKKTGLFLEHCLKIWSGSADQ